MGFQIKQDQDSSYTLQLLRHGGFGLDGRMDTFRTLGIFRFINLHATLYIVFLRTTRT